MKELREAENELFEKIEQLKESIDHQKDTLKNWNDKTPQNKEKYAEDCLNDALKLDMLMDSYILVLFEMINKI